MFKPRRQNTQTPPVRNLPTTGEVDEQLNALLDEEFLLADGTKASIMSVFPEGAEIVRRSYTHDASDMGYGVLDWPEVEVAFTDNQGRQGSVVLHFWRNKEGSYVLRETTTVCKYQQDVNPTARIDYDRSEIVIENTAHGSFRVPLHIIFNSKTDNAHFIKRALELGEASNAAKETNNDILIKLARYAVERFQLETGELSSVVKNNSGLLGQIASGEKPPLDFSQEDIRNILSRAIEATFYDVEGQYIGRGGTLMDEQGNRIGLLTLHDTRDHGNPELMAHLGTPYGMPLFHAAPAFIREALDQQVVNSVHRAGANMKDTAASLQILKDLIAWNFGNRPPRTMKVETAPVAA